MIWQVMFMDIAFMIGGFVFAIALWPSVISKNKPAGSTSATTGSVLLVYCLALALNSFWLAFASTFITAGMWGVLFFQKRHR